MPAFREGPVSVDPEFTGEALKFMRDSVPEDRITVTNSTYDIPASNALVVPYGGSAADAFIGVARLIPVEYAVFMGPDEYAGRYDGLLNFQAYQAFREGAAKLVRETGVFVDLSNMDDIIDSADLARFRDDAPSAETFHEWGDFPGPSDEVLFIRTTDPLPFACVTFAVGGNYDT